MRLSSQSSQFVFNLPPDLIPAEIIESYTPLLEKNWIQYENVLDYINSTIISVNFPGMNFELPMQHLVRGKERMYKSSKNIQDIVGHELTVTFESVDADINYWIIFDILSKHYLDTYNMYANPFTITAVDIHRDGIYRIIFKEIILKSLSDNTFNYSQQKVSSKEFNMTFHYNFYDIEFLLDKSKVLELGHIPTIIQKI